MKVITIKAPGSVMIMGEHAVLHEQPAIVTAIDRAVAVTLTPTNDQKLAIDSSYGQAVTLINDKPGETWAQILVLLVQSFIPQLPQLQQGLHIKIESTFEGAMGLSSSTAVTAAIAFGLMTWCFPDISVNEAKQKTFNHIMQWMSDHGQPASGAALDTILFGGCRYYDSSAQQSEPLTFSQPFYLIYCGYKTSTKEVIEVIKKRFEHNEELTDVLYETIGMSVTEAKDAIKQEQWDKFYKIVSVQQFLLHDLGVSDAHIDAIIHHAISLPNTQATKISGAGLGDCVLVFGDYDANDWQDIEGATTVLVSVEQQGVQVC